MHIKYNKITNYGKWNEIIIGCAFGANFIPLIMPSGSAAKLLEDVI
jgi:hypothetical protein